MPDNRDDAGRFKQGQSGNAGGRPKKLEDLAKSIRDFDDELRERLLEIARSAEPKDSVAAIKLLWSYAHGNPRQVVTDADGNQMPISIMILPAKVDE